MDEKQTIELFLTTGSEEAFCALFESVYPRVRRYFLLRGLDGMTAEDLAQEVLLTVYRRAAGVRDLKLFHGWLFAIARNELMRHWRQQQARPATTELEPLSDELTDTLFIEPAVLRDSRFQSWLAWLEPAERDLIVLRFVEELSYEELATVFDIPTGTVKWRLFNAKKKLSQIIIAELPHNAAQRIN